MKNPTLLPQQLKPTHLIRFREKYGLSVSDCRDMLGHKSASTWSRWETGRVAIPLWLSWALIPLAGRLQKLEGVLK